ncbi:MAG: PilZ domain-containing protein [Phycisphaeraceae bacterium]|nr:PilZ domain-containing protein [Phycisphaeraceae bacterium]
MLRESALHRSLDDVPGERRHRDRVPFPGEATLIWIHDPMTVLRLAVVDASNGGFRLRTRLPVPTGTTGILLRLLPAGTPLNAPVTVAWLRPVPEGDFEMGLRRLR